ncbi:hypothetical protein FJ970_08215 [Mesorhizobium sp. B2-1-8]|nr:hypothetical protein FJ970_08215 [Mesorhizobium sp. B2-1-8]
MTEEKTAPLRERMIEDMRIRGMGDKVRQAHIRAIKDFAGFSFEDYAIAMVDEIEKPTHVRQRFTVGY